MAASSGLSGVGHIVRTLLSTMKTSGTLFSRGRFVRRLGMFCVTGVDQVNAWFTRDNGGKFDFFPEGAPWREGDFDLVFSSPCWNLTTTPPP